MSASPSVVFTLEPLGKPHQLKVGMTKGLMSPETAAESQRTHMLRLYTGKVGETFTEAREKVTWE